MGSWNHVLSLLQSGSATPDGLRRDYIDKISEHTGRNVVCYYSGWLQKDAPSQFVSIMDDDMNGFMNAVFGLDQTKGVDLILHTPGGNLAATEAIVIYLRSRFSSVRAIVPQLAMSAGTMLACACDNIVMGKESSLGPTDPQLRGVAAGAVIEEFDRAIEQVKSCPQLAALWQPIISQYGPTFLGDCEKALKASRSMISEWLSRYMFAEDGSGTPVDQIVETLCEHSSSGMHDRHYSYDAAKRMGLKVSRLEDDQTLQELVLSLHHAYMCTFSMTPSIKIIESSGNQPWIKCLNIS